LAPVIYLGESLGLIVVTDSLKVRTLAELIAMAKVAPGQYSVAVPGLGTPYRSLRARRQGSRHQSVNPE
jgi:tripartite-type tricarboxylate transporter receptor subunit TctC